MAESDLVGMRAVWCGNGLILGNYAEARDGHRYRQVGLLYTDYYKKVENCNVVIVSNIS